MFRQRRLNSLARKIEDLEAEKRLNLHHLRLADEADNEEKQIEAWRNLVDTARRLSKLKSSHRKLSIKTKE